MTLILFSIVSLILVVECFVTAYFAKMAYDDREYIFGRLMVFCFIAGWAINTALALSL